MNSNKSARLFSWLPLIGALAVFFLSACLLTKNVGLANNGDFYRVMKVNRISFADDTDQAWRYQSAYRMELEGTNFWQQLASTWSTAQEELYSSPHFIFVKLAKTESYLWNRLTGQASEQFHMEALSGLYLILLSFSAWGILRFFRRWRTRLTALGLLLFVFCDMGYLLYFHSFYGEALQFVCVMVLTASLLQLARTPSLGWTVTACLAAYFMAGAKLANIPFALCAVAAAGMLIGKRRLLLLPVGATVLCMLLLFGSIPDWMTRDTTYQSVFFGILKESPTPEEVVAVLGLPPEYVQLQNTHAYLEQYPIDITSPEFHRQFFDRIGKIDVLAFYLHHPVRFVKKLSRAMTYSGSVRPPSLANSGTVRMGITNRYSIWSHLRLRTRLLYEPAVLWAMLALLSVTVLWLLFCAIRTRRLPPKTLLITLLTVGLFANLVLPILGNGEADLAKHMFFWIHLVDLTLCAGILAIVSSWPVKWPAAAGGAFLLAAGICFFWVTPQKVVSFAGYEWTVIQETEHTRTLLCRDSITTRPFDETGEYGSNLWETSELRRFLNEDLFTPEEQSRLLPQSYAVTLSAPFADRSEAGWHIMIWTHEPHTAASLWKDAFRKQVTDRVALPTLNQYQAGGFQRAIGTGYWLADPYGSNASMVRYADPFGQVLHQDASRPCGVRPVITIQK